MLKRRELNSIISHVLPELPGFCLHRGYILQTPIASVLQAINIDPSWLDPTGFNLEVFVMPLYVAHENVSLLFSRRLRDPHALWQRDMPNLAMRLLQQIKSIALPYLSERASPACFVQAEVRHESSNPHIPHAVALSLAKAGEYGSAIALIDDFLPQIQVTRDWEQRIVDECSAFRELVLRDHEAAQRQLLAWEEYTVGQLGLGKFR